LRGWIRGLSEMSKSGDFARTLLWHTGHTIDLGRSQAQVELMFETVSLKIKLEV
jgi:hypothetical protein